MKKYIKYICICICIVSLSVGIGWYFSPIPLSTIVSKHIDISTIKTANVNVYSSVHLQKTYEFKEKEIIDNLTKAIGTIKVRRTLLSINTFTSKPLLYNTYLMVLSSEHKAIIVNIASKDYVIVNSRIYKIVNKPNLKQIYDIVNSIK